jgi:hypothetical protein
VIVPHHHLQKGPLVNDEKYGGGDGFDRQVSHGIERPALVAADLAAQRQSAPELAPRVALPIVPRRGCLSLAKFKTCNGVNRFFRAAQVFSADHALEIPRRCECEILRDGDSAGVCGEQIP